MSNETSQYEIPSQLLVANESKKQLRCTEIGEARVVNTIFGRAKVRIVRKHHDPNIRWTFVIVVVSVMGVAFWLWKGTPQSPIPMLSTEIQPVVPATPVQVPAPAPQSVPATSIQPVVPPLEQNKPQAPVEHAATATPQAEKVVTVQPEVLPVKSEPVKKNKPRKVVAADHPETEQVTAGSEQPKRQADIPQTPRSPVAIPLSNQPVAMQPAMRITKDSAPSSAESAPEGNATVPQTGSDQPSRQPGTQP